MKWLSIFIITIITFLFADDVYLNNGNAILGCKVKNEKNIFIITYRYKDGIYETKYAEDLVSKVKISDIDLSQQSTWTNNGKVFEPIPMSKPINTIDSEIPELTQYKYNYKSIPVTLLAIALAYDYHHQIKDFDDDIDDLKNLEVYSESAVKILEDKKDHASSMFRICAGVAVINALMGIEVVEIKPAKVGTGLSVSYRF